jgi:hypothetical protein
MFQRARKKKREHKVVLLSGREGGMNMQTKHVPDGTQENLWDLQSVDQAQGKESIWVDALELQLCERQPHISSTTSERRRDPCDSLPGLAQLVVAAPLGLGLPKGKTITISVIGGPSKGLRRQLVKPTVSIGRSGGGADIEIDDPQVSALHCAVGVKNEVIRLCDLDSRSGTYFEDERVDQDRKFVEVSQSFSNLVGYKLEELIGTRYDNLTAMNTADILLWRFCGLLVAAAHSPYGVGWA